RLLGPSAAPDLRAAVSRHGGPGRLRARPEARHRPPRSLPHPGRGAAGEVREGGSGGSGKGTPRRHRRPPVTGEIVACPALNPAPAGAEVRITDLHRADAYYGVRRRLCGQTATVVELNRWSNGWWYGQVEMNGATRIFHRVQIVVTARGSGAVAGG